MEGFEQAEGVTQTAPQSQL